jgi:hypothetical protein
LYLPPPLTAPPSPPPHRAGESGEHLIFKWAPEQGSLIHVVPLDRAAPVSEPQP